MSWKPIVVGVDTSPQAVHAARVASELATAAGTKCHLVYAVRDAWADLATTQIPINAGELNRLLIDAGRNAVEKALRGQIPAEVLSRLNVRVGRPAVVVAEAATTLGAELIVLGGKHHTTAGRWLAGSTAHHLVRTTSVPVLIVGPAEGRFGRVLAAVDLSSAARPTIAAAERVASLFGARLRVAHTVEPLPMIPEVPVAVSDDDLMRRSEEELQRMVWPLIGMAGAERVVRHGPAADTIAADALEWKADLVVVGSHGKGWIDRILIGSVTEQLLNRLPASILVVPVPGPAAAVAERLSGERNRPSSGWGA
jgi:nucleotide-binding universal stress UspA family protein